MPTITQIIKQTANSQSATSRRLAGEAASGRVPGKAESVVSDNAGTPKGQADISTDTEVLRVSKKALLFLNHVWRPDSDCAAAPLRHRDAPCLAARFRLRGCAAPSSGRHESKVFCEAFLQKSDRFLNLS
jgi:hypothetical protein